MISRKISSNPIKFDFVKDIITRIAEKLDGVMNKIENILSLSQSTTVRSYELFVINIWGKKEPMEKQTFLCFLFVLIIGLIFEIIGSIFSE